MINRNLKLSVFLVGISILLFIGLAIFGRIYKFEDIPLQFMGAFLGAVVTAFITMILLLGQSQSQELKERNVKVFEEKTKRYNRFIKELWKVWDDKEIELLELKELIKLVTQDIVPYTNKKTVLEILKSLNEISENNELTEDYKSVRKKNQQAIYNILKSLSKEIGLGGEITDEIQIEINKLEEKILPVLYLKEFKNLFLKKIKEKLNISKVISFDNQFYKEENNCYYIILQNSKVEIEIENFDNRVDKHISFFVEYDTNSLYNKYRESLRGEWKHYLKNPLKSNLIPSFKNEQLAEKMYKNEEGLNEIVNNLVSQIEDYYKDYRVENKTLEELILECETKRNAK